jgi:dipeptidase D
MKRDFAEEFAGIEGSIGVSCLEHHAGRRLTGEVSSRMIDTLLALPHGVEKMSGVVDDLVETSANLAVASWGEKGLEILLSVRSAVESGKNAHVESIEAVGRLAGARVSSSEGYPGWTPDMNSELLEAARVSCREVLGEEPSVEAIHAGLECGIIGRRAGEMDMISLGPDISDVHVPGESVSVRSVDAFLELLVHLLKSL